MTPSERAALGALPALGVREAAAYTGIGINRLRDLAKTGAIPHHVAGKGNGYRFRPCDLTAFIDQETFRIAVPA